MQKYVFNEWLQTEAELTRERALWGPPIGSRLDKWILDMTEGKCTCSYLIKQQQKIAFIHVFDVIFLIINWKSNFFSKNLLNIDI